MKGGRHKIEGERVEVKIKIRGLGKRGGAQGRKNVFHGLRQNFSDANPPSEVRLLKGKRGTTKLTKKGGGRGKKEGRSMTSGARPTAWEGSLKKPGTLRS